MWGQNSHEIDQSNPSKILTNLEAIIQHFEKENPGITVSLEILPKEPERRETVLTQKRTAIMAGETPDVYLMPTLNYDTYTFEEGEPLFRDVAQAMSEKHFADLSAWYEKDAALHTEELQQTVMDAGVLGESRYILPLGYTFDVLFTEGTALEKAGLNVETTEQTVFTLYDSLLSLKEGQWLPNFYGYLPLNSLPMLCDYETERVFLTKEDFLALLQRINQIAAPQWEYLMSIPQTGVNGFEQYLRKADYVYPINKNTQVLQSDLRHTLSNYLPMAKAENIDLKMIPVRATDGSLTADVTYWGAVSANCQNIDAAYRFLRIFLLPEVQHSEELSGKSLDFGLSGPGWPVRYRGYAKKLWDRALSQYLETYSHEGMMEDRIRKLEAVTIDDSDLPLLNTDIAYARFPSVLDIDLLSSLAPLMDSPVSEEELEKIAADFVQNLRYHLAEG